jgi:hypothetical protein
VNFADCTIMDSPPQRAKGRRKLHEGCAHQVHTVLLRQIAEPLGFASGICRRLFNHHVLAVSQCHSRQSRVTFRRGDDQHNIHIGLQHFRGIGNQVNAWPSGLNIFPGFPSSRTNWA